MFSWLVIASSHTKRAWRQGESVQDAGLAPKNKKETEKNRRYARDPCAKSRVVGRGLSVAPRCGRARSLRARRGGWRGTHATGECGPGSSNHIPPLVVQAAPLLLATRHGDGRGGRAAGQECPYGRRNCARAQECSYFPGLFVVMNCVWPANTERDGIRKCASYHRNG